jgi:putative ATP-dependent endonuclease of the OLD family
MLISRIEIKNFRALREASLDCERLTAIIGRNGSGKSTLLKALDIFYNVSYQATPFDYFAKDTALEISITVTYADLRAAELTEFNAYIQDGQLQVTKIITSGGSRYFGVAKQIEDFVAIRPMAATPKRAAWNALLLSNKYPNLGTKASSAADVDEQMARFEASRPDLLKPFAQEKQFFGAKTVGGGKLDNYTKFVLIPAVRDASSEVERKGIVLQLIDILVSRSVDARPDVQKLNKEFEERAKAVYNKDNLTELADLAKLISEQLGQYAPGAALDLEFGDVVVPRVALPPALASLIEDDFKSPISHTGHGVQRALILALLQKLSLTAAPSTGDSGPASEPGEKPPIPDLILGSKSRSCIFIRRVADF